MTRPITDTLRLINNGTLIDQVSADMAALVNAIRENGGSGTLTLTLTVKKAPGGAIAVAGKHTTKLPTVKAEETLLWATDEGALVTENPKQQKLPLTVVPEAINTPSHTTLRTA